MVRMKEDQKQEGAAEAPNFPFEEIEIRSCRTVKQSEALACNFLADGGTGEDLLAQINARKSPVLAALLFSDHHLPILRLIPDFSACEKPAVYCATANGSPRLLKLLLERGADSYLCMDSTPAFVCTANDGDANAIACADLLLGSGVDIDVARSDIGMTALMRAAGSGRVDFVRHLLAAGADVSRRDSKGCTALHWAVGFASRSLQDTLQVAECVEVARLLLEAGAPVNARDFGRDTPLHHLASAPKGFDALASGAAIDLLLRHGADIEARNLEAATPILIAAHNSQRGVFLVPQLHSAGANLEATARGKTIEDLAFADGPKRAVRAIRMGQNLDAAMPDEDGVQPADKSAGFSPL